VLQTVMLSRIDAEDAGFRAALDRAGLPIVDLDAERATYFALIEGGAPIGFGGIAGTGADRLLRSVVVPEAGQRTGIGSRIVGLLEQEARRAGRRPALVADDRRGGLFRSARLAAGRTAGGAGRDP
jgi:amino-acid N-acetyltransferase